VDIFAAKTNARHAGRNVFSISTVFLGKLGSILPVGQTLKLYPTGTLRSADRRLEHQEKGLLGSCYPWDRSAIRGLHFVI
jgi:hypothetical protein